jgi:integrase
MAQTVKATDADIDSKPLDSGAYLILESAKLDRLKGFMLICNAQSASFVMQRKVWINGARKTIKVKLGVRGEMTVAEAHERALAVLADFAQGKNPNEERDAERKPKANPEDGRLKLSDAFEKFISDGKRSGRLRQGTVDRYLSYYKNHLSHWADRTMEELGRSKKEVRELHERLTNTSGWASANGTIQLLRCCYKKALTLEEGLLANPCVAVELNKEKPRNTAMDQQDLRFWWAKVMSLSLPVKRAYWLIVALTGGRRTQMASAQWSEIDFERRVWNFPDEHCKAGRGYEIPLSSFALAFLKEWRLYVQGYRPSSPFLFPGKSKKGCLSKPRNDKQGIKITAHPLRHTWETAGVSVGLTEMEALLLLGHSLKASKMNHRYVTRAKIDMASLAKRQEAMTAFFLKALGIGPHSIQHIIWSKVDRGAWKEAVKTTPCLRKAS